MPAVGEHLTAKDSVDQVISKSVNESFSRLDPDGKLKLDVQKSLTIISTFTSPKTILEQPSKAYDDSLCENEINIQGLPTVFNDQDNGSDEKQCNKFRYHHC